MSLFHDLIFSDTVSSAIVAWTSIISIIFTCLGVFWKFILKPHLAYKKKILQNFEDIHKSFETLTKTLQAHAHTDQEYHAQIENHIKDIHQDTLHGIELIKNDQSHLEEKVTVQLQESKDQNSKLLDALLKVFSS